MSDDAPGNSSVVAPPEDAGKNRRDGIDLKTFSSPKGESAPGGKGGSSPTGKKAKRGRPTKNTAGFSKDEIDEVVDDPEIEAARQEFESVLVGLLVSTTDNIADARFEVLKTQYAEAVARGLADKARLTEKERGYFGGAVVRIWRKYLGDQYLFSEEGIAAVYALNYMIRNWEPMSQAKKIEKEINANTVKPGSDKQPGLQGEQPSNSGGEKNGKINPRVSLHPVTSSPLNSDL